jgi:diguanylate cyclase (GGDEF)-like protein
MWNCVMTSRRRLWIVVFVLVAVAVIARIATVAWVAHDARQDALAQASLSAKNLRTVAVSGIDNMLDLYVGSFHAIDAGLNLLRQEAVSPIVARALLFNGVPQGNAFGSIIVVDAKGDLQYDSRHVDPEPRNFADRDYFIAQRDGTRSGIHVSAPLRSKMTDVPIIVLSWRLSAPDGTFRGVIAGSVKLDYFSDLLAQLNLAPGMSVSILRDDGTLIMRAPFDQEMIGKNYAFAPLFSHYPESRKGEYISDGIIDGGERLNVFGQIGHFPLVIVISQAREPILQSWSNKVSASALIVLVLIMLGLVLGLLVRQEFRLRAAVEQATRQHAADMEQLAMVDKLTGLSNRRHFDDHIAQEWERHLRENKDLGLLLIDVDYFKQYNDVLGHAAGDEALHQLADCIRSAVRPYDFVSRIGGEEFAVVLPGTDAEAALSIAERIRQRLADADLRHPKGILQRITVSIGVATTWPPASPTGVAGLVAQADAALYGAKRAGRDRAVEAGQNDGRGSDVVSAA